ncbi:MAG TPA: hypothetical protein VK468_08300 [Pyrinomonadaceae bacterium]|nr:hypothetical protein [Pyrinomonadaceae bacterium]
MKLTRSLVGFSLIFSLAFISFLTLPARTALAQESAVALQRGYRTGYSDGYMAGYRDTIDNAGKSYARHGEYEQADRAYNKDYGTVEDYRDGYQQGFEAGYDTGFEKRSFEATIPSGLAPRGIVKPADSPAAVAETPAEPVAETPAESSQASRRSEDAPAAGTSDSTTSITETAAPAAETPSTIQKVSYRSDEDPVIIIPRDTELIVELQDELTTERAKEGDKFTARVVSPAEISGATIEGRVEKLQRPGRIKRRSEMLLSFDRIIVSETRWSNFDAILSEVMPVKGDNVRRVDGEGTAVGKSSIKPDALKVGAATGTGIGIGAIAGGPVGAAVGAGVGAAFGVGSVVIQRGKDIKLNRSQQLRIKSSYETQIR